LTFQGLWQEISSTIRAAVRRRDAYRRSMRRIALLGKVISAVLITLWSTRTSRMNHGLSPY
jgi:hypothetical protein